MNRSLSRVLTVLLFLTVTLAPGVALAVQSGSASGSVHDDQGGAVPGVTVVVKGTPLPAGRQAITDQQGKFRFPSLPPGTYTVSAQLQGMGEVRTSISVRVDNDTQVKLTLRPTATAAVEVTAEAAPIVDVKSTEVQANVTRETFEKLPLGRSYAALFQLAPGVAENGNVAPNAGGNRQDNLYLYDGANITNPFFGDIYANFSQLDIQEMNIKRGGITAEFGRTGGFVTNAVTKSGTNDFHGEAVVEYQPGSWYASSKDPTLSFNTDRLSPALGLGGPIVKDVLWFYASGNFGRSTTGDRTNQFNVRKDAAGNAIDPPNQLPDQEVNVDEGFGKVTAAPSPKLFLNASYRYRKSTSTNNGIGSQSSATVATDDSTENQILDIGGTWFIGANAFLEAKYNGVREDNRSDAVTKLPYLPTFDPTRPDLMGQFVTTANLLVGGTQVVGQTVGASTLLYNQQDFYRDEFKLSFSWFGRLGPTDHEVKAGFGYDNDGENLSRVTNAWGQVRYSTSSSTCGLGGTGLTAPCFTSLYNSQQPVQESTGRTYSIFLQDRISIGNRFNLLLGLLANRDEWISGIPSQGGTINLLTFGFGDTLQPRIGVTFVPDEKAGDKLYGNYGRYMNIDNKSLARAASPYRIFQSDARIDMTGRVRYDAPRTSETGKVVLPDLKPMYTDEFLAGYARPLFGRFSAEVWWMWRQTQNMIDDYPTVGAATNSPSKYVYGNLENAYRKYQSVSVELTKQYSDNWTASLSYSWSKLQGNWDLDYASQIFYSSSALQDGPGLYVEDPNREGILIGDRTHVFKLFGSYTFLKNATVGGYLRFQSGLPYEARGFDYTGSSYRRYLEPAGSRRLTSWTNFDLLASYTIPIGDFAIRLEGKALNLFDSQPVQTVDTRAYLTTATPTITNPNFGQATSYATPRRFVVSATFAF